MKGGLCCAVLRALLRAHCITSRAVAKRKQDRWDPRLDIMRGRCDVDPPPLLLLRLPSYHRCRELTRNIHRRGIRPSQPVQQLRAAQQLDTRHRRQVDLGREPHLGVRPSPSLVPHTLTQTLSRTASTSAGSSSSNPSSSPLCTRPTHPRQTNGRSRSS